MLDPRKSSRWSPAAPPAVNNPCTSTWQRRCALGVTIIYYSRRGVGRGVLREASRNQIVPGAHSGCSRTGFTRYQSRCVGGCSNPVGHGLRRPDGASSANLVTGLFYQRRRLQPDQCAALPGTGLYRERTVPGQQQASCSMMLLTAGSRVRPGLKMPDPFHPFHFHCSFHSILPSIPSTLPLSIHFHSCPPFPFRFLPKVPLISSRQQTRPPSWARPACRRVAVAAAEFLAHANGGSPGQAN